MAVNTINFRLQDDESDTKRATLPFYVPTGFTLAQYQAFATAAAPIVDAVTGSLITDIDMSLALTVPSSGIKTVPVAEALNERGGLIGMDTAGQFNDSVRIPAILWSIMTGDEFSLSDPDISAFTLLLTAGDGTIFPRDKNGFVWQGTGLYGRKSFRRK